MKKQTIKIYVEGGVVTEVANLPIDCDYEIIDQHDISMLKQHILSSDTSIADLVSTAWAAAS